LAAIPPSLNIVARRLLEPNGNCVRRVAGVGRLCEACRVTIARLALLLCLLSACSEQPKRAVEAVIVDIGPHPSPKWRPDELIVTARSADGAMA